MRTRQRKVRLRVIERLLVDRDDVHITAFVVRVARATRLRPEPPVIAAAAAHVARDVLVAVEAQRVLRGLVESHMTAAAFLLVLRVSWITLPGISTSSSDWALAGPVASQTAKMPMRSRHRRCSMPERDQYMCTAIT